MLLGEDNVGASRRTGFLSGSQDLYATLADPSVNPFLTPVPAGVLGKGTYGIIGAGLSQGGVAVYATDDSINGSSPVGSGACTGVHARLNGSSNFNSAVVAETAGTGSALQATVLSTANTNPAVVVVNSGSGPAIEAYDGGGTPVPLDGEAVSPLGSGPGIVARLQNLANDSPALSASTVGTGPAAQL